MGNERTAISGLKWTAAGRLAAQLVTWSITIFVIRILRPEDYGLMAIVGVVTSFGTTIAEMGLGGSLVSQAVISDDEVKRVAGLMIVIHTALALVIAAVAPLVAMFYGDERLTYLIAVSGAQCILFGMAAAPTALLAREMNFKFLAISEVAAGSAASVATLVLALGGAGVWALVLGNASGSFVRLLVIITGRMWIRPTFNFTGVARHVRYGASLAGSRLAWSLATQSDILIGARILPKVALGTYSVGLHLAVLPMERISTVINKVAFPTVARSQENRDLLRTNLIFACRLLAAGSIPLLWGISSVSRDLVPAFLGEKWLAASLLVQLVSLVVPLRMINGLLDTSLAAVGRADALFRNCLTILCVWPICFFVGSFGGAVGLAASWLVAAPLGFVLTFGRTRRILGLTYRDLGRALATPIVAGLVMYLCVVLVGNTLPDDSLWIRLTSEIAVGAISYLGTLLIIDRGVLRECWLILRGQRGGADHNAPRGVPGVTSDPGQGHP